MLEYLSRHSAGHHTPKAPPDGGSLRWGSSSCGVPSDSADAKSPQPSPSPRPIEPIKIFTSWPPSPRKPERVVIYAGNRIRVPTVEHVVEHVVEHAADEAAGASTASPRPARRGRIKSSEQLQLAARLPEQAATRPPRTAAARASRFAPE